MISGWQQKIIFYQNLLKIAFIVYKQVSIIMSSSIIADAKYQELNMSFTFDEQELGKIIVNAVADNTPYQLEFFSSPDLDLEDLKNIFLSKQFKVVSKTPEILKIKIAFTSYQFKNVEKMTLNTLKKTIAQLSNEMQKKDKRINGLEHVVQQLRHDLDQMTAKMADYIGLNQQARNKAELREKELKSSMEKMQQRLAKIQKVQMIESELKYMSVTKQQNCKYIFSSLNKSNSITVSNNNTKAANHNQAWVDNALSLVEGFVFRKGSSIRFKIQSKGYHITLGLALKSVAAANSFQLQNHTQIGHGCLILFHHGQFYSHSNKDQNQMKTNFNYGIGDVIRVETNVDDLLFINETNKNECKMKLILTEDQWKQVRFCAQLERKGDSVSIL